MPCVALLRGLKSSPQKSSILRCKNDTFIFVLEILFVTGVVLYSVSLEWCCTLCPVVVLYDVSWLCCMMCPGVVIYFVSCGCAVWCVLEWCYTLCPVVALNSASLCCGKICLSDRFTIYFGLQYLLCPGAAVYFVSQVYSVFCVPWLRYTLSRGYSIPSVLGLHYAVLAVSEGCNVLSVLGLHCAVPEGCSILCFGVAFYCARGLHHSLCPRVAIYSVPWGYNILCVVHLHFSPSPEVAILCPGVMLYSLPFGCGMLSALGLSYTIY